MTSMDDAARVLRGAFDRVVATQQGAIAEAARLVAAALPSGGILQVFGTGHSKAFAMELAGRAGGLVPANQLAVKDLVFRGGADPGTILDPLLERDPELAARLLALYELDPHDVFVIASNSGGNGAVVELARLASARGHPVVAVTSLQHSRAIVARHPSGQRLFEIADVVIDNGAVYGDAELELSEGAPICPTSSVTGAVIAQLLVAEVCRLLTEAGQEIPVLLSANVAEGDAHNERIKQRYGARVADHEP